MPKVPRSIAEQLRDFCAYQERCKSEVEQKLYRLKVPKERWAEFIIQMEEERFLDEERFSRAYVRGKFRLKGWGRTLIRQGLHAKGLPRELIEGAIESEIAEEEYLETARKWVRRVAKESLDTESRQEVMATLMRKGYSWSDAQAAMDAEIESADAEDQ